jgi:hypothetical protein
LGFSRASGGALTLGWPTFCGLRTKGGKESEYIVLSMTPRTDMEESKAAAERDNR